MARKLRTVEDIVEMFTKKYDYPNLVRGIRITQTPTDRVSPLRLNFEVVIGNGDLQYVVVGHYNMDSQRVFLRASKTRLTVPFTECPDGARVFIPYEDNLDLRPDPAVVIDIGNERFLVPDLTSGVISAPMMVEIHILSLDDRIMAGGKVLAWKYDINSYLIDHADGSEKCVYSCIATGCRFELWAAALAAIGEESVFELPTCLR